MRYEVEVSTASNRSSDSRRRCLSRCTSRRSAGSGGSASATVGATDASTNDSINVLLETRSAVTKASSAARPSRLDPAPGTGLTCAPRAAPTT